MQPVKLETVMQIISEKGRKKKRKLVKNINRNESAFGLDLYQYQSVLRKIFLFILAIGVWIVKQTC